MTGKVLFVDDDVKRMTSHVEMLEDAGYAVDLVSDVDETLQQVQEKGGEYACVILDIMMPPGRFGADATDRGRHTGLPVLKEMRRLAPDLPIVVLTVIADPAVRRQAMELGAKAYLTKPCLPSDLVKAVRRHLG